MKKVIKLYKEVGETPLECIKRFQAANQEYKNTPMTYAGRLDPMAEGVLLVLTGEECKQKEKYLALDKEYEVEILFGFATDSYDILGKITQSCDSLTSTSLWKSDYHRALGTFLGKFTQKYPKYSSKMLAKSKGAKAREVEIYSIKFLGEREVGAKKLLETIENRISKVKPARPDDSGRSGGGDFRQEEILRLWRKHLGRSDYPKSFSLIKIKVACSSGTYMRSLAHNLGKKLKIPGLAFSIKRTKIMLAAK